MNIAMIDSKSFFGAIQFAFLTVLADLPEALLLRS
jgi:hypothetical protein